jgi:methylenetetrahydrofolate dehydrogenase (NADP+)/methenyltetrahydrofolate cyclohydrolase
LTLSIIQAGDDPASNLYIKIKKQRLAEIGFECKHIRLDLSIAKQDFERVILDESKNPEVHGLIVQFPLPEHLKDSVDMIPHYKDVDGITVLNQGMLFKGYPESKYVAPCTAIGCMHFLSGYKVALKGARVAVFGKSALVTKPLISLLQNQGATVISFNRFDQNQAELSSKCEVLISAIGKGKYITKDFVQENAFVVDIGLSMVDGKLVGDVSECVLEKTQYISASRGGIGPLTVACLISNLVHCYDIQMAL